MLHVNNWKNRIVFEKQLRLNKKQLAGTYPPHWISFIRLIKRINKNLRVLDVGCGVGVYSELCRKHLTSVSYTGIDYSDDAITLAKSAWSTNDIFITKDFNDIDANFISNYNLIHLGALLDVLPYANTALDKILKLAVEFVLISRIDIDSTESLTSYVAYEEIITYKDIHSMPVLLNTIHQNNYQIWQIDGNNILLTKIQNDKPNRLD